MQIYTFITIYILFTHPYSYTSIYIKVLNTLPRAYFYTHIHANNFYVYGKNGSKNTSLLIIHTHVNKFCTHCSRQKMNTEIKIHFATKHTLLITNRDYGSNITLVDQLVLLTLI